MKFYRTANVFDEAIKRLEFIFNEFDDVIVSWSGGKDSTVTMQMALLVAEKRNRLPLTVMFLDQEAEWSYVIEYAERLRQDPRINFKWYQIPIKIENATSNKDNYLITWEPGKKWMRDKDPESIKENVYGTVVFYDLFNNIMKHDFKGREACNLGGVRAEESPPRAVGLTNAATYKHITYGKVSSKKDEHYHFYPLYDWSYTDIWKAIHDNHWDYCKIYDLMYMHGVGLNDMRVSNLNHETSIGSLYLMQEVDNVTWNALCARLDGINSAVALGKNNFMHPQKKLPFMFADWKEYRDYLLDNLITDEVIHNKMKRCFDRMDIQFDEMQHIEVMYKNQIGTILTNDSWLTKISNFIVRQETKSFLRWKAGQPINKYMLTSKYIKKDEMFKYNKNRV